MALLITQSGMSTGTTSAFSTNNLSVWLHLRGDFGYGVGWIVRDDGMALAEGLEAWGSGADCAVAAVLCGKDSRGACEVSTQVDLYSGGPVRSFSVETGEEL